MAISLGHSVNKAQINVTPMIDVLLVLIIIFMVITPVVPTGLDASLPQDAQQGAVRHDTVITVLGNGSVRLNEEPVELAVLHERLLRIFGARANSVVFIRGDKDLDFAQIAEVIDIAKGAGIDRIGLMTH